MWKRYKHLIAYLTLAIVPVFIVASISYVYARDTITRQALSQLESIAILIEKRTNDYLERNEALFTSISDRLPLHKLGQGQNQDIQAELNTIVKDAKNSVKTVKDIDILDPQGAVIASTRSDRTVHTVSKDQLTRKPPVARTILFKDVQNQLGVVLAGPLRLDGQIAGFANVYIDPDEFNALTSDVTGLGETGEIAMAMRNADGDALTITTLRHDVNAQLFRVTDRDDTSKPIIRAIYGNESTHHDTVDYRGKQVMAATRYIEKADWGLTVKTDRVEALAPLRRFGISLLALLFLIMALSIVASILLYRKERSINRSMDEFVSLASHQLRTPSTKVKMMLGMLLEGFYGKMPDKQRSVLAGAYESNESQLQVINDLLQVSAADSTQMQIKPKLVNVSRVIEEVAEQLLPVYEESNQVFKLQLPARAVEAWVDKVRFRMVVENLLTNAHKYTPKGGKVWVRLQKRRGRFVLAVRDTGVGIAQKDLNKLYKKFSRIHNSLSVEAGGTGLGLYLSHKIVDLHKGTMSVKSVLGKGTTFTVEMPTENPQISVREFLHLKRPA